MASGIDAAELQRRIGGEVVERDSTPYEQRRREMCWNQLLPSARPAAIVHVADSADVAAVVRFAREAGVRVAVRGGGHNCYGSVLRDDTLLLDLSRLTEVHIDADQRTAAVQPAAENRDVARRLQPHGLAFPYGHCPQVRLSGYLLSGGLGWNSGAWGPACANVKAVEVVTADGRTLLADAEREPDLFWAARGAGASFFAVATRFHLDLKPLPGAIQTTTGVYPLARRGEVAAWLEECAASTAANLEIALFLAAAPPGLPVSDADGGMACLANATVFADSDDEAAAALARFEPRRAPGRALLHQSRQPTSFETLFGNVEQLFPNEQRVLCDSLWSEAPAAEMIGPLGAAVASSASPRSLALAGFGAPASNGAFAPRGKLLANLYSIWEGEKGDAANRAWFEGAKAAVEPLVAGRYIGEADISAAGAFERCFTAETRARLQSLRERYDPARLFASLARGR